MVKVVALSSNSSRCVCVCTSRSQLLCPHLGIIKYFRFFFRSAIHHSRTLHPSLRHKCSTTLPLSLVARRKSDNLSAPLCLFPEHEGESPTPSGLENSKRSSGCRTSSHTNRRSRPSVSAETLDQGGDGYTGRVSVDGGGTDGVSNGVDGSRAGWGGEAGGGVGRLWMTEDGGYLCVDLLLGRTLSELAEGLAFAAW